MCSPAKRVFKRSRRARSGNFRNSFPSTVFRSALVLAPLLGFASSFSFSPVAGWFRSLLSLSPVAVLRVGRPCIVQLVSQVQLCLDGSRSPGARCFRIVRAGASEPTTIDRASCFERWFRGRPEGSRRSGHCSPCHRGSSRQEDGTEPQICSCPAALGPEPVRREEPVVPPPALVPSQFQPPPVVETEAAWGNLVSEGLRTVETAEGSATAGPSASESEFPANREPNGLIGAPEVHRAPMIGPLSLDWPFFPRSSGPFTFDDLVALGRRDARLVQASTDSDASWAEPARDRFLRNFWLGYQVPQSLPCDRTMIFDANDGVYLELTVDFLAGKRDLPA